jgi:cell pole-organizing protein PopZ
MGEALPKEGSMEDILASIRQIISADTSKKVAVAKIEPEPIATADPIRKPIPVETQKPVTGSLSALAEQIKSERNAASSAHQSSDNKDLSETLEMPIAAATETLPATKADSEPLIETSKSPMSFSALAEKVTGRETVQSSKPLTETAIKNDESPNEVLPVESEAVTSTIASPTPNSSGLSLKDLASKVNEAACVSAPDGKESNPNVDILASAIGAAAKSEANHASEIVKPSTTVTEKPAEPVQADSEERSVEAFKEALVAPSTQAAVTNSMDRLRKSVEDIDTAHVENVLRPMLKTWLDENLPSLVEKMVQTEISKITAKK